MAWNDFLAGDSVSAADPLAILQSIAGSAPPQNMSGPAPVRPIAVPRTPVPIPQPPPQGPMTHVAAGGAPDWTALISQLAPLIGSFALPQTSQTGFLEGWQHGSALADQTKQQKAKDLQARNQAAANYRLEVGQHALGIDDPIQRAQFIDLAESAGAQAGLLQPGDLASLRTVPPEQSTAKARKEAADKLKELKGEYGDGLDGFSPDTSVTMNDGSRSTLAQLRRTAGVELTGVGGDVLAKPGKVGNTEEERFVAKWAKARGLTMDGLTDAQELEARKAFREAGRADVRPPAVGGVDAQFNDLVDLWKQGHPGQELPLEVKTKLRAQANAVNDKPGGMSGQGPSGGLTDDAVDYAATQYRVTGQMPALGMGNANARSAIINRAAAQAKGLGQTPAAAIQKQAAYKADAASLTKIRQMSSSASAFETKALGQADIIRDLSSKVSRTSWPIINDALLAGKARIAGDSNTQQLFNAISTSTSEYAKIMEGSTGSAAGSSEGARTAASRLISASLNPKQLTDTLDLMAREMRLTMDGYNATIESISGRMGAPPPSAPQPPSTTSPPAAGAVPTYQDYLRSKKGGKP